MPHLTSPPDHRHAAIREQTAQTLAYVDVHAETPFHSVWPPLLVYHGRGEFRTGKFHADEVRLPSVESPDNVVGGGYGDQAESQEDRPA